MATKTNEQLQAENDALQKKLDKANSTVSTKNAQLKDLSKQLQVAEATKGSKLPAVKVGDTPYVFTAPKARVGKQIVTAEEAAKDADLCADLVKKGSGWLKAVSIPEAKASKAAKSETANPDTDEAE